ncbi:MAG: GH116 family glycosyl-hydrolase [Pirellulaceae bacterium]
MADNLKKTTACTTGCACRSGINRRDLLRWTGAGALALGIPHWSAMAGPFDISDFEKLVPADKRLSAEWVKSLYDRGEPDWYTGEELKWIGMPVGGLCAGQLYLGGDGRLWHWDIFNQRIGTGAAHYAEPLEPAAPLEQGFGIRVNDSVRTLDRHGFTDIRFRGEYPIAKVEYRDQQLPVAVHLEAFSPFVPLNENDSSLPVTVMRFTVKNTSDTAVEVELAGWLENAVCLHTAQRGVGTRHNRVVRAENSLRLECSATEIRREQRAAQRSDILFENWDRDTYDSWSATGNAFGSGPILKSKVPEYQGDVGGPGKRVANSHATAPGNDVSEKDNQVGTLTSREFTLDRDYITFWIGGGDLPGATCLNLIVDSKPVLTATGHNENRMRIEQFDVRHLQGKTARLQIVDNHAGAWGNIGVGEIVLSDTPAQTGGKFEERHDFGTMALALLQPRPEDRGVARLPEPGVPAGLFAKIANNDAGSTPFGQTLSGGLSRTESLGAGEEATITFLLAWNFPNDRIEGVPDTGRYYATRFSTAGAVVDYVADHFTSLYEPTRLWRDTWYDSTLPHWFLDRTLLNTSILASSTCHRFASGRFYGWEGVGCCAGTCTHVWQYAQAVARLFPALERDLRERTDFGLAFDAATGIIRFRGEGAGLAVDGQAGCILRSYREHQMSSDDQFLKRNWPKIKRALQCLIDKDGDGNGILESNQHNTLDTDWFGPVAWLSGVYLAALRAGEQMAHEVGDSAFAGICRKLREQGQAYVVQELFNGEYFINQPDPNHLDTINSGTGCEIDQVLGQSWAWQVGLGRVFAQPETLSALKSLWRYNFTPDVGPYREIHKPGRWYAMPGEAGLLMCTFPRSDWDYSKAAGKGVEWAAGYFNECMNGFEYQVAGHMIWEGLVEEGLAVTRAVHDRYHPSRRNPWNEIECGDHYARSMASYGIFLAACGFEYHGPSGHIGFAPRLSPEHFRAAFTSAEGWGTYEQKIEGAAVTAELTVRWGTLRVRTVSLSVAGQPASVRVTVNGNVVEAKHRWDQQRLVVELAKDQQVKVNERLRIEVAAVYS